MSPGWKRETEVEKVLHTDLCPPDQYYSHPGTFWGGTNPTSRKSNRPDDDFLLVQIKHLTIGPEVKEQRLRRTLQSSLTLHQASLRHQNTKEIPLRAITFKRRGRFLTKIGHFHQYVLSLREERDRACARQREKRRTNYSTACLPTKD
jgi:hypothetical protein